MTTLTNRKWKFPGGADETDTSKLDIPEGSTNIDLPETLLGRYRNLSFEFLFSGVTATDENLKVKFYRANSEAAFSAANIESVGEDITFSADVVANADVVFFRDFKNVECNNLRAVVEAPAGVTAELIVNVVGGGQVV